MKILSHKFITLFFIAVIAFVVGCGPNKASPPVTEKSPSTEIAVANDSESTTFEEAKPSSQFEIADIRILYAGHPGSEREKDYVEFLKPHFKEIETTGLADLTDKRASGCDVLILDYDGDGFKAPRPRLSNDRGRATITVGVIGAFICDSWGLKTGYL